MSKKTNLKNLKVNTEIKFLFDNKENEIVKFEFPITKSKKFYFLSLKNQEEFFYSEIITNLNKKLLLKRVQLNQVFIKVQYPKILNLI